LVGEEEFYEVTAEKQAEVKAEQASRAAATARSRAELRGVRRRWEENCEVGGRISSGEKR
jgi:hypothetical protein